MAFINEQPDSHWVVELIVVELIYDMTRSNGVCGEFCFLFEANTYQVSALRE